MEQTAYKVIMRETQSQHGNLHQGTLEFLGAELSISPTGQYRSTCYKSPDREWPFVGLEMDTYETDLFSFGQLSLSESPNFPTEKEF